MNNKPGSFFSKGILIPAGLLVLNLVLRMLFLDSRDLAMDEPFTVFFARSGLPSIFRMLPTENNPPLFFIILHYWIKIFGISVFSVRFLSCVFSSLLALVIWIMGKKFFSGRVALTASLLYTFSNFELLFSHEARVYPLFALLAALSFFFLLSMVREPEKKRYWILLAASNILMIYSHFFGFIVILAQWTCLISIKEAWRTISRKYLLILLLTLVSFIPYMPVILSRFHASSGGTWIPAPQWSDLYTMVWRFSNAPVVTVLFIAILAAAGVVFLVRTGKSKNKDNKAGKTLFIWFFFPYLLMFLVSFRLPVFLDRYMIFVTPAWFLLIALAVERLDYRNVTGYVLAAVSVLAMAATFTPNVDNKRRINEVVDKVETLKKPGVPVIICPEWLKYGFAYYYDRKAFEDSENLDARLNMENIHPVNSYERLDSTALKKSPAAIYFEEWATLVDKDNRIYSELRENFPSLQSWKVYESYSVFYFSK